MAQSPPPFGYELKDIETFRQKRISGAESSLQILHALREYLASVRVLSRERMERLLLLGELAGADGQKARAQPAVDIEKFFGAGRPLLDCLDYDFSSLAYLGITAPEEHIRMLRRVYDFLLQAHPTVLGSSIPESVAEEAVARIQGLREWHSFMRLLWHEMHQSWACFFGNAMGMLDLKDSSEALRKKRT